ncbi:uncharacterized protein TRAVEDRAFT_17816 [Trametes versicolor FP-101664 SS1]|uniref:uncharacterized protein n=1 Tax=Trametes versicolor (strain FP-101664) TaxID=717944 RepID=UPI0004621326|nr:uncharacterized protein TRAVEDRAFT_17816 [Trametes versicolor FP-101664 SS1]EIW63471.1 hypothetical protein TRAVEDRAFT_17816 [Trametes versicolor FP-101664 SS1]
MPPKKKTKTSHSRATAAISGLNSGTAKTPDSETESNATDVAKPRRHVRGRRGGLKDMPNMPFDIIMEIVQLLHPRDVLNLARTTKGFRAFLMDRKQEFLWKAARANVEGLPALPPWLCEPSYANLMFFPQCHGELGKHAKDPYLVPEAGRSRRGGYVYFKPQIDDFRRKWAELSDREEQIRFVQECQKDTDVCLDISRELEEWASDQKENRKQERDDLKAARIQAVEARLHDEGWEKELAFMNSKDFERLHGLPAVCKPAALTDRAWKGMQHDVVALMQGYRNERVPRKHIEPLLNDVQGELGKHAKDPYLVPEAGRSRRGGYVYFKPQIDDFRRKWAELSDREEQIRFVQECQKDTDVCLDISRELEEWASDQKENRKQERDDLKAARIQAVEARLHDEGWEKELAFMNSKDFERLHGLPAVCKPAALTDRAWKGMQHDVVALMQGYRNERLVYERRSLLVRRMRLMREAFAEHLQLMRQCEGPRTMADDLTPQAGDVAYLPQFREVIEAKSEVAVTKASFAPLLTSWPELSASWTAQHKAHFTEMLLPALKDTKAADFEEVLDLAIATFRCLRCQAGNLRWPFVLIHGCFRSRSNSATETDFDFAEFRDIINMCGEDPDMVTWEAMQERPNPARLMCKDWCLKPDRNQVFDWRAAFDHMCKRHSYREVATGATRWQLVSEEEAAKATKLAEALDALNKAEWYNSHRFAGSYNIACSWCTSYCSRYVEQVRTHLKKKHGQDEPREGVDYSESQASLMRMYSGLPPVWICSADLADNDYIKRMVEEGKGFFATSPAEASEDSVPAASDI